MYCSGNFEKPKKLTVKKTVKCIVLMLFVCVCAYSKAEAVAAEEGKQEVTIYSINSSYLEKISIPAAYPQSYQWNVGTGTVTYKVTSGNSAKVSSTGLITPKLTYWKRQQNFSMSVSEGEPYDYYTMSAGDTIITAQYGTQTSQITVHVTDYTVEYCNAVLDQYIEENYVAGMSDSELMKMIVKFPARYDYSPYYSGVYSMIINGGGDCWASTSAIITLSERLNSKKGLDIKAWSRNGNRDAGAGSGHMNAMIEYNGKYYELEAGYSMSKDKDGYRPYDVRERATLFSYRYTTGGIEIYQYDGMDSEGRIVIPETISGKTVVSLGESAFSGKKFSEIVLPDTLVKIDEYAFNSCSKLEKIEIPASVTEIGVSAFVACYALEDLSVVTSNVSYKADNGVIYSKDGAVLVACPVAANITIPSTVTRIADYAFYYNKNITDIVIPETVTELGEGAFGNCTGLSNVTIEGTGLIKMATHCFRNDSSLTVMRLPSSVENMGAYAFASCNKLKYIYFGGSAPSFGETINGTFYDNVFYGCTLNAYYPEGDSSWNDEALANHGGTVTWTAQTNQLTKSISSAVISFSEDTFTYTGSYIKPALDVTLEGQKLVENEDYVVSYSDNLNAGTAIATVTGIGSYEGKAGAEFTIGKALRTVRVYLTKTTIAENETTTVNYISPSGDYSYSSGNESVATVDSAGNIKGVSAGTTVIRVTVAETSNYLAATGEASITVKHDGNKEEGKDDKTPDNPDDKDDKLPDSPDDKDDKLPDSPDDKDDKLPDSPYDRDDKLPGDKDNTDENGGLNQSNEIISGNAEYKINPDNTVTFMNYKGTASGVVIPDKVNGHPVTGIAGSAFKNCKNIKKVTIGKNVKTIGNSAFEGCKKLKTIIIKSAKIKKVGRKAIKGIRINAVIKVPKSKHAKYKNLFKSKTGFKKTMKIKKK